MLTTVAVSTAERAGGALLPNSLAAALAALRADGIVNLGAAIDPAAVDELREAMLEDMRAEDQPEQLRRLASGLPAGSGAPMSDDAKPFSFNGWGSLRPPPQHPHLHADIVYNPMGVAVSCEYLGDASNPTLTTYGANSAYPGNGEPQNTHRDVPNGREHVDATGYACPGVVINVPLQDFTLENGATQVFLGTHLVPGAVARKGDLLVRDLRLAHNGMPNTSTAIRTMIAMVHIAANYRGGDESPFKGFTAEAGTEEFWSHPRLGTAVFFEPAPVAYRTAGHSTPPTALRVEFEQRKQQTEAAEVPKL